MSDLKDEGKVKRPLEGTCMKCSITFAACTMEKTEQGWICRRCSQRGER
jgi:heterodisulfide reductase subunit C